MKTEIFPIKNMHGIPVKSRQLGEWNTILYVCKAHMEERQTGKTDRKDRQERRYFEEPPHAFVGPRHYLEA